MKYWLYNFIFSLSLLFSPEASAISEYTEVLKRDHWPEYVNGTNVSALPQVSQILKLFLEDDKISIEIRYPGGELGRQWAESLANWFVTFGVPKVYLELLPGSGAGDQLVIALIDRR